MSLPQRTGVYRIVNIHNGHRYYGSTTNLYQRWNYHRCALNNQRGDNPKLQKAWGEFGEESFVFEVILYCQPWQRHEQEQVFLDLHPEYNTATDASAPWLGRKMSAEIRAKMSAAHRGRPMPAATRAGMQKANEKAKRPLEALDPRTDKVVHRYDSVLAARQGGFNPGNIVTAIKTRHGRAYGLEWRYAE